MNRDIEVFKNKFKRMFKIRIMVDVNKFCLFANSGIRTTFEQHLITFTNTDEQAHLPLH